MPRHVCSDALMAGNAIGALGHGYCEWAELDLEPQRGSSRALLASGGGEKAEESEGLASGRRARPFSPRHDAVTEEVREGKILRDLGRSGMGLGTTREGVRTRFNHLTCCLDFVWKIRKFYPQGV